MKYLAIFIIEETLYKYSVKGKGIIMADLLVQNYNSGNFKYNVPVSTTNGVNANATAEPKNKLLEKQPQTDTVILSDKKTLSKQNKILLALGGIATTVLGAVLAVKGYRSHQITKGIEKIEQKFLKIQENMPEVQKTFKEVFLRDDITEKEALEMLNRYKEVEKIRITGTKEEYARALFEEAKRNYGFENSNLKIFYEDLSSINRGGSYCPGFSKVEISSANSIERFMNVIHHELRHVKQTFYTVNAEPDRYVQAMKDAKKGTLFEKYIPTVEDMLKPFNMTKPDKTKVPSKYKSFVEDMIQGAKEHTYSVETDEEYFNNINEVDARFAGESIAKLFGLMAK